MAKNIDEKIEELKSIIPKIDGHTRTYRIGNRLMGLTRLGLGSFFTYQHHYLIYKIFKLHPDYEIKELEEKKLNLLKTPNI